MADVGGERIPLHVVVYGDAGAGKSTFAATFPKPMLVCAFDPFGKDIPYLEHGVPQALSELQIGNASVPMRNVVNKHNKTVLRVEHYIDRQARNPQAYAKFLARFAALQADPEYEGWKTIVIDSVTFMELAARKDHQYRLNPTAKHAMQWFAGSTDYLEEMLMIDVGSMPINVVIVAHIDEDKDEVNGMFVRNPKAPGRLGKGKGLSAAMVEVYRAFVGRNAEGDLEYLLQTQTDMLFNCASRIKAPNPSAPHFKALWANSKMIVKASNNGGEE